MSYQSYADYIAAQQAYGFAPLNVQTWYEWANAATPTPHPETATTSPGLHAIGAAFDALDLNQLPAGLAKVGGALCFSPAISTGTGHHISYVFRSDRADQSGALVVGMTNGQDTRSQTVATLGTQLQNDILARLTN